MIVSVVPMGLDDGVNGRVLELLWERKLEV